MSVISRRRCFSATFKLRKVAKKLIRNSGLSMFRMANRISFGSCDDSFTIWEAVSRTEATNALNILRLRRLRSKSLVV